jgi:hypothetical protein
MANSDALCPVSAGVMKRKAAEIDFLRRRISCARRRLSARQRLVPLSAERIIVQNANRSLQRLVI